MKVRDFLWIGTVVLMLVLTPSIVSAEGQMLENTDPEGDVLLYAGESDIEDDLDLVFSSVDWSGDRVTAVLRVKGEMVSVYDDGTMTVYFLKFDTTKDTNGEEVTICYATDNVSVVSNAGADPLTADVDYTIEGDSLTVHFDKKHLEGHGEVLDISASSSSTVGTDIMDYGNLPGDDDPPDDDTTDDDTPENNTSDDEKDTPGFSFHLITLSAIASLLIFGYRRRMD